MMRLRRGVAVRPKWMRDWHAYDVLVSVSCKFFFDRNLKAMTVRFIGFQLAYTVYATLIQNAAFTIFTLTIFSIFVAIFRYEVLPGAFTWLMQLM
jgi:hypothetical protein